MELKEILIEFYKTKNFSEWLTHLILFRNRSFFIQEDSFVGAFMYFMVYQYWTKLVICCITRRSMLVAIKTREHQVMSSLNFRCYNFGIIIAATVAPIKQPKNKREMPVPNLNRALNCLNSIFIAPLKTIPASRQIPKKYIGTWVHTQK